MATNYSAENNHFKFLNNEGDIAQLLEKFDWCNHPMGCVKDWSPIFRSTLSIIINSAFPMFLFWGKEYYCFYNDAFTEILSINSKEQAIGKAGKVVWTEIWDALLPVIKNVMNGEKASLQQDQPFPILKNGKLENVFYTHSYSRVNDEEGNAVGVFVVCSDTTDKVNMIKTLRESRDELAFAINGAELGTWEINPLLNKLTINNRMKSWFGLKEDSDVELQLAMNIIDITDRERVALLVTKALDYNSGGAFETDYKIINPLTKEIRIIRSKGRAFFNENKKAYNFSGILLDITQEMNSRDALIESENNFRKLVEQAPVAICVLKGENLKITLANNYQLELWGKPFDEIINKPLFAVIPPAKGQEGFEQILFEVLNTGTPYYTDELPLHLTVDGKSKLRYLNIVYEPFRDNYGNIEGVMSLAIDVTVQVIARITIEEAEERLRLATDAVNLGTFDINLLTDKFINTDRVLKLFGFDKQVTREEFRSALHPDDLELVLLAHKNSMETGKLFYEARVIWKDKTLHWIRTEGKIAYDQNKIPIRLLGTVLDITDKKNAADELIKINQRLEIALEAGQLGSFILDVATGTVDGSQQLKIIYGMSKDATLNFKTIQKLIIEPYASQVKQAIKYAIENKTVINIEYQIKWRDNTYHWIKTSAKALYNEQKKLINYIGVTAEITEQKKLQQQKDDFIGFASHELKTPVTTIMAYSQLAEEMLQTKGMLQEAGMIGKISIQVKRLNLLIADLLDVTKINSGKLPVTKSRFNFNELIKSIVEDVQNTYPKLNILQNFTETGFVLSDKERVVQVTNNLISNAIKYSPNNTKIIIHTYILKTEVVLVVQDFGVGIEKEFQEKLFDQFYRVSGNIQDTFPGLGLGLYISSEIIKQLGGRIWVTSNLGEGANFYYTLPAHTKDT